MVIKRSMNVKKQALVYKPLHIWHKRCQQRMHQRERASNQETKLNAKIISEVVVNNLLEQEAGDQVVAFPTSAS
jgi:hypothetical protein